MTRAAVGICTICLTASSLWAVYAFAGSPTATPSIKEVMTQAHKKPRELLKQVARGKASAAEKGELLALYRALAASTPPRGDQADWDERTGLLVAAAQAAVDGEADAGSRLRKAANCRACHDAHKSDE